MPDAPHVVIYTDGACSRNPGPGGWGAILIFGEHRKELSGGEALTTNNRMELTAAIAALEALKRPARVELNTDSEYVRNGISQWLPGWKRRGWRTAGNEPVKNLETPWHSPENTPAPSPWLSSQHDQLNSEEPVVEQASSLTTSALSTAHADVPATSAPEEHTGTDSSRDQEVFAHTREDISAHAREDVFAQDGYDAWAAMPEPATDTSAGWGASAPGAVHDPVHDPAHDSLHDPVATSSALLEPATGESRSLQQVLESAAAIHVSEPAPETSAPSTTQAPTPAVTETPAGPNLEDVVAKVLARMNPEMFQSVTQQLLKPVIEAIVRSELEKKQ